MVVVVSWHEKKLNKKLEQYTEKEKYWKETKLSYLFVRFFQMFHQNSHNHIDKDKLGHKDKNNEKKWREIWWNATIS